MSASGTILPAGTSSMCPTAAASAPKFRDTLSTPARRMPLRTRAPMEGSSADSDTGTQNLGSSVGPVSWLCPKHTELAQSLRELHLKASRQR